MYMGDTPSILQGAAQRETLTAAQIARLEAEGIPTMQASTPFTAAGISGMILPIVLTIGGFLLLSGRRGRSLWGIIAILLATPAAAQLTSLNDPPVLLTSAALLNVTASSIPDSSFNGFVGESLRVVMAWQQPTDGGGNADSTFFSFKSTKGGVFARGNLSVLANIAVRRKSSAFTILADTFKLLKPPINDSVLFAVNGLTQCRKGKCSVPGSAAWGYFRSVAPPAATFIRVTVDSF